MSRYIGIDPGAKGALAVLGDSPEDTQVFDLPLPFEVNPLKYFTEIWNKLGSDTKVFLENVHALPNQSTVAGFTFGVNVGFAKQVAAAAAGGDHSKVTLVTPQRWKKYFGLSRDKHESVELARKLFPTVSDKLLISKDGRAEALLIAQFGKENERKLK